MQIIVVMEGVWVSNIDHNRNQPTQNMHTHKMSQKKSNTNIYNITRGQYMRNAHTKHTTTNMNKLINMQKGTCRDQVFLEQTLTIASRMKSYSKRFSWSCRTGGKSINKTPFLASWNQIKWHRKISKGLKNGKEIWQQYNYTFLAYTKVLTLYEVWTT